MFFLKSIDHDIQRTKKVPAVFVCLFVFFLTAFLVFLDFATIFSLQRMDVLVPGLPTFGVHGLFNSFFTRAILATWWMDS